MAIAEVLLHGGQTRVCTLMGPEGQDHATLCNLQGQAFDAPLGLLDGCKDRSCVRPLLDVIAFWIRARRR